MSSLHETQNAVNRGGHHSRQKKQANTGIVTAKLYT